jgi:aldose sugar dehydrogenase
MRIGVGWTAVAGAVAALACTPSEEREAPPLASRPDTAEETAAAAEPVSFALETVVEGLETVWDMTWGPDGILWISERGGRISRVDVAARTVERVGQLQVTERGESGLMGLALHPDFPAAPWVYAVHSYSAGGGIRNRLVRMRWEGGRLGAPQTLLDDVPGGTNHDGSRLAFGPDGMLYMTTGDAGSARLAQDRGSLAGKILRLTPEGRPAPGNPFGDAIFSLGHRNPQGLVFHPETGALYASEHGPDTDDEVNLIERGRNYGWPDVRGFCDSASERAFCAANAVVEPVEAWTPTVAVAGADFYRGDRFPEWRGSLLVTALRGESLFRLTLTPDGRRAASSERLLQGELGRIRDVAVGPDGAVYLATSNRDGRGRPARGDDRIVRLVP